MWILLSLSLICILFCSGCVQLTKSYVPDTFLLEGWYENTAFRNTGIQLLGLEKWNSITYEIQGRYPASMTITTVKTLMLSNEADLLKKTKETIETTFQNRIHLDAQTTGERQLANNHQSRYIVYTGSDLQTSESVNIIGEVWNCGTSGSSVICIGMAYITNKEKPDETNMDQWQILVEDPQGTLNDFVGATGLLYNINCH
jgi:hypothetical protein